MKKLLLAIGVAISLSGCQTAASVLGGVVSDSTPVAAVSDKVVLQGTKGLAVAADAYAGAADSVAIAVKAGHFNDDQLRTIQALNDRALALLKGSDSTLSYAQRAAGVMLVVTQLHAIIGK
jgi:hypothetical protein